MYFYGVCKSLSVPVRDILKVEIWTTKRGGNRLKDEIMMFNINMPKMRLTF